MSIPIFLNKFAGPHDHLCCWNLNALKVLGSSLFTYNKHEIQMRFRKLEH